MGAITTWITEANTKNPLCLFMTTIITHPRNLELLRKAVDAGEYDRGQTFPMITIRTSESMEPDKPTGRFILPGGRAVKREEIRLRKGRFVEYGPEDVGYLLFAGVIREEREPLFYMMEDRFMIKAFEMPIITPMRSVIVNSGW